MKGGARSTYHLLNVTAVAMQAAAMPPQVAILQKKVQVLQSKLENQARLHEFDIDDRMQEQAEAAREHTTRIAESEMAQAEMAGAMDRLQAAVNARRYDEAQLRFAKGHRLGDFSHTLGAES